jgi:hypothetical protein
VKADPCTFNTTFRSVIRKIKNVSDKLWKKSKHFMFNNFPENRGVYEIIWKTMVQPTIPIGDSITRRMRFACELQSLFTHTHTHRICNT